MSSTGRIDRGRRPASRRRRSLYRPEFRRQMSYILERLMRGESYHDILEKLSSGDWDHPSDGGNGGERPRPTPTPPQPTPTPQPQDKDDLEVTKVDFKVPENTQQHHTDAYDITEGPDPQLVVRRGQPFNISIQFSRPFKEKRDDLRLIFEIGDMPIPSKNTQINFVLSDKDKEGKWGGKVAGQSGKSVDIQVFTPPTAVVGKWSFSVQVVKKKANEVDVSRYDHKNPIYMLFNPWCKDDQVYMEGDQERQAYVLSDSGKLFTGNEYWVSNKPWIFGQFSGNVLDCILYLLEENMDVTKQNNVIKVARKLSALVNMQDSDGGVLFGNWSGNYSGGTSPTAWAGSIKILEQYYREKKSVKYGQCWVFSGLLTTVCRGLGIPCRSVTNFSSAHDTDGNTTIDTYFDAAMDTIEWMNSDSVWNFHVWNEAWMTRPDLPEGYGGWQAIDATPQETSDGFYQCGPCPVRAIKEGEISLPYDGPFIFAEVNADKVFWKKEADGTMTVNRVVKNAVGKKISTLSLDGVTREDVTDKYKYKEGSPEERIAVLRARRITSGPGTPDPYGLGNEDVDFRVEFNQDTPVGVDFKMTVICTNHSDSVRNVKGHIIMNTMYYTGIPADRITKADFGPLQLQPGESNIASAVARVNDYLRLLKDGCHLRLVTGARVQETNQVFSSIDTVMLGKPTLTIQAPPKGKVGQEFEMTVSFTNPLNITMTDCYLQIEGPGVAKGIERPQRDVQPGATFLAPVYLKPYKKGKSHIVVVFSSTQLTDIDGEHDMVIEP